MKKLIVSVGAVALLAVVVAQSALASATYDFSAVSTGFTAQLQGALTTALPIAAGVLALFVGWKIIKRFVRA